MKIMRGRMAVALGAVVVLGGCGGISMSGPGAAVGLGLGSLSPSVRFAPANCQAWGSGFVTGGLNASAMAGERFQQFERFQSRYSLGASDVRARQGSARALAAGAC